MTRDEHILVILAEECSEVAKVAAKALRFGLDHMHEGSTNRQKLADEFADLVAVFSMISTGISIDEGTRLKALIAIKDEKVKKFLEYSKKCGTLTVRI